MLAHVVEERQENDNVHMSEPKEVIMMDSIVVSPSDVQEQIATQNKAKRKGFAINAPPNSFDNFRFISLVHQERYSKFLASKRPKAYWMLNKDGMPEKLRTSDLTPVARAWARFVLSNLLPCSNVSDLTIQQATLVTAILKGEPVNVGRLLAGDLWGAANCSSSSSYISHASLVSKLCERVGVYPENNEEMVKPYVTVVLTGVKKS
ncbi:hypothetical protein TSUD_256730 [Trifolium subterraneum]|uniref:Putative plant transposon protein domain-containing protein n=1 Tax=Trifolium subterraneum TaxID=3900 RepID=A0A2Z6MX97_TRISU|nr:hypothetical protein TSUD_256730 [Trifolium subterraneum]